MTIARWLASAQSMGVVEAGSGRDRAGSRDLAGVVPPPTRRDGFQPILSRGHGGSWADAGDQQSRGHVLVPLGSSWWSLSHASGKLASWCALLMSRAPALGRVPRLSGSAGPSEVRW